MTPAATTDLEALAGVALRVREHVVEMCTGGEGGHLGGSLSVVDVLVALYFAVLRVDPARPAWPGRDRLVLSKGHAAPALYATLAERGFLPVSELRRYARPGGRLMGHPSPLVPGVELPTGSLGHGLPLGLGLALAARHDRGQRCVVVLGDGELQEGSVWEAAMAASALRLGRLCAVVDRNGLQLTGTTEHRVGLEPLAERWSSFGWAVSTVDGHDLGALVEALGAERAPDAAPLVVIANTVKAKGVPPLEGRRQSHYVTFDEQTRARVLRALRGEPR